MFDIVGAANTLPLLSTNTYLTSMGVVPQDAALLSSRNMMAEGAFALLAPKIQTFFPTREEVGIYVFDQISTAFRAHHEIPQHSSGYGIASATITGQTPIVLEGEPIIVPKYISITSVGRPIQTPVDPASASGLSEDSSFDGIALQFEPILVWAASPAVPYIMGG